MNTARSNPIRMLLHLLLSLFSLMDNPCPTDSYLLCVIVKILVITHFAIFTHQILASSHQYYRFHDYLCFGRLIHKANNVMYNNAQTFCICWLHLCVTFFKVANEIQT